MASADNEATDGVQENEETEQTEAEKQRKMDSALIRIKSRKRTAKIKLTKLRHELEKLCVKDSEIPMIESAIEQLWKALENTLDVLEELSAFYIEVGDTAGKNEVFHETETVENEVQTAIEEGQNVIKNRTTTTVYTSFTGNATNNSEQQPVRQNQEGENGFLPNNRNRFLKPLEVPTFDGDKRMFEDFWALFESLVDASTEPANLKMARLRQSLTGNALEAIRGLGVSTLEYDEAKKILQTKFGGTRRLLRAYMDQLEKLPTIRINDVQALEKFADLVGITVVKLQAEGRDGELEDGTLHSLLVKKLPERQLENYSRWTSEHAKEKSVTTFRDWLKEEARFRVEAAEMANGFESKTAANATTARFSKYPDSGKGRNFHSLTSGDETRNERPPCSLCQKNDHGVWFCKQFHNKCVDDRWQFAKEKKLCFRCLASDHRGKDCRRSKICGIDGCARIHHRLLHGSEIMSASTTPEDRRGLFPPREGVPPPAVTMTCNTEIPIEPYSLRTVPLWIKANGRKVKVNAILDDASNETFLNEEIAGVLGLQEPLQKVQVHVLNDTVETFQSMPLRIELESVDGRFTKEISVKTCPRKVTGGYRVVNWRECKSKWPHLLQCDFAKPANDGLVDLLIGIDNADLHYSHVDLRGQDGGPIARLGPLGWTCIGSPDKNEIPRTRSHAIRALFTREPVSYDRRRDSCCDIDQSLKRFWEIENSGTESVDKLVLTEEEKLALIKVQESLKYENGRYCVGVPWKEDKLELPDTKPMALSRLQSTEKNLKKNDRVAKEYQATIEAYVEKGYLRKVPLDEQTPVSAWYLPHFPVVRMDKTTTKVRIVFDCSAKCKGTSLNDMILAGPKLQQDLFNVLVRFRRNPVGIVCDIKEMYLQIEIKEEDRPYFRLLWRDLDCERQPDVYEFSRVVFGKNAAPMESQFVAQENARRNQDRYPLAAETVLKSTYMDDSIDSVEDDEKGVELYHQLSALWRVANMQARKWISNSPKVIEAIPEEDRATEIVINGGQNPITKTLGVSWNSTEDVFTLVASPGSSDIQAITKRNVLRKVASIFDPLGFVGPFIIVAKILIQELWSRGYDWDDEIQDDVADKIEAWFEQLQNLDKVKIPRCLRKVERVKSKQIVTFVDASQQAYGAVVYLRCEYENESVTSRLIAAKSKVAPLTPMTVPRLELMGAILGLRLTQSLLTVLEVPMRSVTFYSDSTDVLWWIRGRGKDFRPFVANRIGEIQMFTEPSQWQHVSTEENPADLCTRGATPSELAECHLWWNGPDWLTKDFSEWSKMEIQNRLREMPEMKTSKKKEQASVRATLLTCYPQEQVPKEQTVTLEEWKLDPKHFSSWTHLVRIHARVRRVVYNMRSKDNRRVGRELLPEEIKEAEEEIVRLAQRQAFRDEYLALSSRKPIPSKSQLTKLCPKLDEEGCIRSDGRLRFAEFLPYDTRYPLILPRGHCVTKLIVRHYHELSSHSAGTNFILSQVSQKYWIIAAREEIREWERECNMCKRRKNKVASQIMAPLPKTRLGFSLRPFSKTAVDYAGPFITVQGRGLRRQKRWICLFTCLTTRAVHLEVSWGLDTDSFLNAFARFTSRRGIPEEVCSDRGTNFVGAANELRDLVKRLDQDKIRRSTVSKSVKWNFNPPGAPHFGGAHEIMVKAAKKAIYAVLSSSEVTDEELITVCTGAESLLNSRPLTYQSADPKDDVPLTPNHFLHGQMGGQFAPENVDTTEFNPRKRWRKVQELISHVWTRWMKEYLPMLNTRPKWTEVVADMKEGDVVLALDSNLPRGHWPLGRIVETYPGKDGRTRVAKVQCGTRTVVRPVHKLVPLHVEKV